MSESLTSKKREAALRTANSAFQVWESRTQLVKQEMAAASAANDAKTARLKALRLEKKSWRPKRPPPTRRPRPSRSAPPSSASVPADAGPDNAPARSYVSWPGLSGPSSSLC